MIFYKGKAFYLLLAVSALLLQLFSSLKGIMTVPLLIAVGLPVYLAARQNPIPGIIIYLLVSMVSAFMDISATLFFICITGSAGLSLGIARSISGKLLLVPIPAVLLVFTMLAILNYHFGVCIFDSISRWTILNQAFALMPCLYLFCLLDLRLFMLAERLILGNLRFISY